MIASTTTTQTSTNARSIAFSIKINRNRTKKTMINNSSQSSASLEFTKLSRAAHVNTLGRSFNRPLLRSPDHHLKHNWRSLKRTYATTAQKAEDEISMLEKMLELAKERKMEELKNKSVSEEGKKQGKGAYAGKFRSMNYVHIYLQCVCLCVCVCVCVCACVSIVIEIKRQSA